MNNPPPLPLSKNKARNFIILVSLVIPLLVTLLYFLPKPGNISPEMRQFLNYLPVFNALNNGTTAVVLFVSYIAIRKRNILRHRRLMTLALVLSAVFLVSYVTYHSTSPTTTFGGTGFIKGLYYSILITHILFSAVIVPLVLITYSRGLSELYDKHRRIGKITLPIWLYVAVTGVLVYIMIRPYYPF